MTEPRRRRRVPAMAPEERRTALVEATVPLLREFGADISTRQIAEAAGVAEGTIFGVFPDKASLIRAAVVRAMDPEESVRAIGAIDRGLDLRTRLEQATAILIERMAQNVSLMTALFRSGAINPPEGPGSRAGEPEHGPPREIREGRERVIDAVVALIGPDAYRLRRNPGLTVGLLVSMVFVASRGGFGFMQPITAPEEIVSLLLDGLLREPDALIDARAPGDAQAGGSHQHGGAPC